MKKIFFIFLMFISMNIFAQSEIGANCSSDLECGSLCCNSSTSSCAPHDPSGNTPAFCNKEWGQTCVTNEFCTSVAVTRCKIVKTGTVGGKVTCALRCPTVMTHGSCIDYRCNPPENLPIPTFDPDDCSQAVDP